jgi:tetratricopeptide (TPR) repeat protein
LKGLNIGSTRITDAGLQYIRSESLETINLESCDVTEHGLRWLAALPKLKSVQSYKSGIRSGAHLPSHLRVSADEGGYQHVDYDQPDRMLIFELDERLIAGHTQSDEISELDHHRRGNVYVSTGAYAQAVEEYEKAIDELLHPQYHVCSLMAAGHDYRLFECYDSRAMALAALGEHVKALMDINQAIAICRISSVARAHRGYVHFKLGQLELALDDLNRAIELKPNLSLAYEYRSEVFEAQGKTDLAAKDRDTSRQLRG